MNLLFVCTRNRLRSPTAQEVFAGREGVAALSAGTNKDADTPLSGDLIEWADVILVMEAVHRKRIARRFPRAIRAKRLVVLAIPDVYEYMQPELIALLKAKVGKALGLPLRDSG